MANIGELNVKLGVNPNDMTKGLAAAGDKFTSFGSRVGAASVATADGLKTAFAGVGGAISSAISSPLGFVIDKIKAFPVAAAALAVPILAASAAMAEFVSGAAKIRDVSKAALKLGADVGEFQKVAVSIGDNDAAVGMLSKLQRHITGAAMGSRELELELKQLGLESRDLAKIPITDAYRKVVEAIAKTGNAALQTSSAIALFGKGAVDQLDKIRKGTEGLDLASANIEKYGLSFSAADAATIKALDKAKKNLGYLKEGLTNQITLAVAPILLELQQSMDKIGGFLGSAKPAAAEGIAQAGDKLGEVQAKATLVQTVVTGVGKAIGYAAAIGAEQWNLMLAAWDLFTGGAKALGVVLLAFGEQLIDGFNSVVDYVTPIWDKVSSVISDTLAYIVDTANTSWGMLAKGAGIAWDFVYDKFGPVIDAIQAGFDFAYDKAQKLFGYIISAGEKASALLGKLFGDADTEFTKKVTADPSEGKGKDKIGGNVRQKFGEWRKGLLKGAFEDNAKAAERWGKIGNAFAGVNDFFNRVEKRAEEAKSNIGKDWTQTLDATAALHKAVLTKLGEENKDPFAEFQQKAAGLAEIMAGPLVKGNKDALAEIQDEIDWLKSFTGAENDDVFKGWLADAEKIKATLEAAKPGGEDILNLDYAKRFAELSGKIQLPGTKGVGALEEGSKEAYSAIAAFNRGEDAKGTIQEQVLALEKQAKIQRDAQIRVGKEVAEAMKALKKRGI